MEPRNRRIEKDAQELIRLKRIELASEAPLLFRRRNNLAKLSLESYQEVFPDKVDVYSAYLLMKEENPGIAEAIATEYQIKKIVESEAMGETARGRLLGKLKSFDSLLKGMSDLTINGDYGSKKR